MSLTTTFVGDLVAAWSRRRAVARLTEKLERSNDRLLDDVGVARADISQVALAAYPSRTVAAAVLRSRTPWVFTGVPSHG
jgi:uncharacterized protein YjiS (DUF1127 family)